jgi:hypothetical protein
MNLRCLILLSLMMLQKVNFGQGSSSSKLENGDMNFDLRIEYFQHLDSAFAVNHHLAEVVMYEANYDNGKLIYNEPIVKYRFDEQGRRTYIEQNYWTAIGFTSRYTTYYKDSLVNVQHEKYTYTDGNKRDSKYVFKFIRLNDSLSTSSEYSYEFDSLKRVNYNDTVNKKAELRKKMNAQKNTAVSPSEINSAEIEKTFHFTDLHMHGKPYDRDPKPSMVKDSSGKVTEIHTIRYMHNDAKNVMVLPESSYFIKYNEQWKKVTEITKYSHWSNQNYKIS